MSPDPRDPNRYAKATQTERSILVDKTGMLTASEQALERAGAAIESVAAQLAADAREADKLFNENFQ